MARLGFEPTIYQSTALTIGPRNSSGVGDQNLRTYLPQNRNPVPPKAP